MYRSGWGAANSRSISRAFYGMLAVILAGCSGSGTQPALQSLSSVTMTALTPSTVSLQSNQQVQFSVSVAGASNTTLQWNIVDSNGIFHFTGDASVGTVSAAGLYVAPIVSSTRTFTILVGASADTSIQRSAVITVVPLPPPVTISISPTTASAQACNQTPCPAVSIVSFSAQVLNAVNTSVTWQVNGKAGGDTIVGTISTNGVYTAPNAVPSSPVVTVTAVSNADNTKNAPAQVTITAAPPPIAVNLNQVTVSLVAGQSFAFIATDNQGNPLSVTYSSSCSASDCGSFTTTGPGKATYTAPSAVPGNANLAVVVTATAVADTTKSRTAVVTVAPPIAPSLSISFTDQVIHAGGTTLLTAVVNNAPSGIPTPIINWTQAASAFCISSDEETGTGVDRCGDNDNETDGPGKVNTIAGDNSQAIYVAPSTVFNSTNGGLLYPNNCTQATLQQPYVYVTASAVINGTTLNASACLRVSP